MRGFIHSLYNRPLRLVVYIIEGRLVACIIYLLVCTTSFSCKKDEVIDETEEGNRVLQLNVPSSMPYPEIPDDNQPTRNRVALGKKLFFDPILSRDSTVSCSSCHHTDKSFTDNQQLSTGIDGRIGVRNAPSIINMAYQPYLFWDGGVPTLEQQVLAPIDNHLELDFDVNKIVERLGRHKDYPTLFLKAYNRQPDVYAFVRAIACYERTLIGGTSRYDRFLQTKDSSVLSMSERRGLNIFFGESGECFHCHQGYNLTDNSFRNNGLYEVYADSGRGRVTLLPSDMAKFKVPSLRNIEKTYPYMHDGSFETLEQVVAHYVGGGKKHPNKSTIILPLKLDSVQQKDLVNFLKCLTDTVLVE